MAVSSPMMLWFVAVAAGSLLAAAGYAGGPRGPRDKWAALCRALAGTLLVALALDAPVGRARAGRALVAVDASASMARAGGGAWRRAVALAEAANADSVMLLSGDSTRMVATGELSDVQPRSTGSSIGAAVERAVLGGRSLYLVTDGEVDDAEAASRLPGGSTLALARADSQADLAIVDLAVPATLLAGDTAEFTVTVRASAAGAPARSLLLQHGASTMGARRLPAMRSYEERTERLRAVVRSNEAGTIRALISGTDSESANDTLESRADVTESGAVAVAATAPDQDVRFALQLLRGALALPVRGYLQVAPGVWRDDRTLRPVAVSAVRAALASAPLAVLQGDTLAFGTPATLGRGALLLMVAPSDTGGEFYPSGAPPSPLATGLSGLPWDSLAPVAAGPRPPAADWTALEARLSRRGDARALVSGRERPRRTIVVHASGLWRWHFRGGAGEAAFAAVWGSIVDWLLAAPAGSRAIAPESGVLRAGERLRWARSGTDTSQSILVRSLAPNGTPLALALTVDAGVTSSEPLPSGRYVVVSPAGNARFTVNASREMIPRRPSVRETRVPGVAASAAAPGARSVRLLYAVALLLLCAEWVLRRRAGLR